MSQLRILLGLKEVKPSSTTGPAEEFGRKFRERMGGVNRQIRVVAVHASAAEHRPLEDQRARLIEAFQKTSAQIASVDHAEVETAIQRVMAAIDLVEGKASKLAADATAGRDQWLAREAEFDDAMLQIGELEEAEHPKADTLRKLGDAIRSRANSCNYSAAKSALGQLLPKLERTKHEELVIELTYDESYEIGNAGGETEEDRDTEDDGDLAEELADAEHFVQVWDQTLNDVSGQVERLRNAMKDSNDYGIRGVYNGLATVIDKFPDLDLTKLVAAAKANDHEAYDRTLEQTAREIRQTRELLANGPLLSTIDENPFVKTDVHAVVNRVLNEIVEELDVRLQKPSR